MKLNILKFGLAGGILVGGCFFISTIFAIIGIPGFDSFVKILESIYGYYGYSISFVGALAGALWGFIEGLIHFGILAFIYNLLNKNN